MPPPTRLAAELSALDEARQALASGDAATSLRMLDGFDRNFEKPSLGPEASMLRIEALLALGQVDSARRLGERLLTENPGSAYSQRVHSLVGGAASKNP